MAKKHFYKKHNILELWERQDLDTLYLCCENLIIDIINRYPNLEYDMDDKLEIGYIAFMKAVKTFDPQKKTQFSSLLVTILINEILQILRKKKNQNKYGVTVSLNEPVATNKEDSEITLEHMIKDEHTDIEKDYISEAMSKYYLDMVKQHLNEKEKYVVMRRIEGATHRQIANEMNISASYCSRIESKLHIKMKKIIQKGEIKMAKTKINNINQKKNNLSAAETTGNKKSSLLKQMIVGAETGAIYDKDEDNIYIQMGDAKIVIPHDSIDHFVEELCEFVEK